MADKYEYGVDGNTLLFGDRDALPPNTPNKIISGTQFDTEFYAIAEGKLDKNDQGNFDGVIDGGTY